MDQTTANHIPILRKRRAIIATLAAAVLLGACGSDGDSSASAPTTSASKPAAAKENATTAPVCYDLYKPTVQVGCAENTIGPGGGVIFYDAKTVQSWGRFLEVAPQKWNGELVPCPTRGYLGVRLSACGAAVGVPVGTTDWPQENKSWRACTGTHNVRILPASAANLPDAIGTGRANTAAMLAVSDCTRANPDNDDTQWSSFQKAANYRGGGLADWFIPSGQELLALCRFGNRNAVGGFPDLEFYISSTTSIFANYSMWTRIQFDANCTTGQKGLECYVPGPGGACTNTQTSDQLTRPIRAF